MNPNEMLQMVQRLKSDPIGVLAQRGINIPQNLSNSPQAIVQYMLNNGMVNQQQVNQVMQMARNFKM